MGDSRTSNRTGPRSAHPARAALGVHRKRVPLAESAVRLTPTRLAPECRADLVRLLGAEHVLDDDATRLRHAGGKSTLDLLHRQESDPQTAPDAVVLPADHGEVLSLLEYCAGQSIAVVPFGGGTSVVGGVDPDSGRLSAVIVVDLRRLNALTDLDPVSRIATVQAGATGPQAEELLVPTVSHSVTTLRVSATQPSAGSRPPGPPARPLLDTGDSTTWSNT